jgi:universal stress protein E
MIQAMMEFKTNRILAVIDPTQHEQWALHKALSIAKSRPGSEISAFLCVHSTIRCNDVKRLRDVELRRHSLWLEQILAGFVNDGIPINPVVEWNEKWREAICSAAKRKKSHLVVKRASGRPESLANSDRQLIRTLQNSALLLVKNDPATARRKILVAVDFNATDVDHKALNEAIMELGSRVRGSSSEIELHSICAYPDSDKYVHAPDIAKLLGIERSHAHIRQGRAVDLIPEMANKIHADLVILGNVRRRGLSGIVTGNTAEKILKEVEADVLVLVETEKRGTDNLTVTDG